MGEISLNICLEIKTFKKLFSILSYNMNTNILDLNNDVLNIIGEYVKKDYLKRMISDFCKREDEKIKREKFKYVTR